jgi:hypothetical protein
VAVWPASKAGSIYFLVVFAAGFVMGTVRVVAMAPTLGHTGAVILELPVMLTIAWFASRHAIARFGVPAALSARLTMGTLAFVLVMLAEVAVSVFAFQNTLVEHIAAYRTTPALLGLAGQIVFALFPAMQLRASEA